MKKFWRSDKAKSLLLYLRDIAIAAVAAYLLFGVFFQIVIISGSSMEPTLSDGNIVVVRKLGYSPKRGDIVIVDAGRYNISKRIIGIEGDYIEINYASSIVSINGDPLLEPYVKEKMAGKGIDCFEVGSDEIFVLGDNRNNSLDSRSTEIGCVDERNVLGKVLFLK